MSGAGSTSSVALRPWPAPTKDVIPPYELHPLVDRLAIERGGGYLRPITEKSLQDQIDAGKCVEAEIVHGVEKSPKNDAPTRQERFDEIATTQQKMFASLNWAGFYASNALDLVAQLLSTDTARNLDASFTKGYKSMEVPKGSFGLHREPPPDTLDERDEQERRQEKEKKQQLVARGSRMEALEWSTNCFLKAASQLEGEVRRESTYWNEVISISEKGWPLQRFRREARNSPFAVRYGFPEASDHFKARGLAPLRMDKDGGIILDPALALKPKTLRVRLSDNGKDVGTSCLSAQGLSTDVAVEKSIQLARDSLFEEEIYHEMSLETRKLLAYGVELRNSVIQILVPGSNQGISSRKILIDCIPRDDDALGYQNQPDDWLAQNVAEALRLLLNHEHRMRLFRRSQLPLPLTQKKEARSSPPLLRTLIAILGHLNAVDSLQAYLFRLAGTLNSAGLTVSLHTTRETSWVRLTNMILESERKDLAAIDQLLEVFSKPFSGSATLSLPSSELQSEKITIATRTYIGPPSFGAEYKVTLPPSIISVLNISQDMAREFKFSSVDEVKSYLNWILSLDLSHSLIKQQYGRRATNMSKEPRVSIFDKDGKRGSYKDVAVHITDGRLSAAVVNNDPSGNVAAQHEFSWEGTTERRPFKDVLKSWLG
ncbi:hypothetical protein K504DRAFT_464539 [Pleomassaria siparia CBS 279.74]|uniref:Mediator of RNA polymerase II transcription subunit 17 n=1 Tax=Pleomassaria siparia CBS 279.74 TaxID=1314801 RepID=A0A6G1KIS4_9PLEO|nr:hypothetical protein K504DRAFT_464539 [Pleomassaria siparia CBS 279.74]